VTLFPRAARRELLAKIGDANRDGQTQVSASGESRMRLRESAAVGHGGSTPEWCILFFFAVDFLGGQWSVTLLLCDVEAVQEASGRDKLCRGLLRGLCAYGGRCVRRMQRDMSLILKCLRSLPTQPRPPPRQQTPGARATPHRQIWHTRTHPAPTPTPGPGPAPASHPVPGPSPASTSVPAPSQPTPLAHPPCPLLPRTGGSPRTNPPSTPLPSHGRFWRDAPLRRCPSPHRGRPRAGAGRESPFTRSSGAAPAPEEAAAAARGTGEAAGAEQAQAAAATAAAAAGQGDGNSGEGAQEGGPSDAGVTHPSLGTQTEQGGVQGVPAAPESLPA